MPLIINLRTLAKETMVLQGELSPAELDFGLEGDIVQVTTPLQYDLEVELVDDAILVRGSLLANLACECVRCLKKFQRPLEMATFTLHLPLSGEEALTVDNDKADLTPFLREDMLLELPQHPLCKPECAGLKKTGLKQARKAGEKLASEDSAWAELNKLKL